MGNKGQYSYKFMIFYISNQRLIWTGIRTQECMIDYKILIEWNQIPWHMVLPFNPRCRYFSIGLWGSLQTYFLLKCHPLKTLHVTSLYKEAIRHQNKMYGFWKKACGDIYAVLKLTYSMFQIRTGYRILFDHLIGRDIE